MTDEETKYDAVIVGAGVSGLFMFYKLKNMGSISLSDRKIR